MEGNIVQVGKRKNGHVVGRKMIMAIRIITM
jgi:hypothetical protein